MTGKFIPGCGNPNAKIMFIGESPDEASEKIGLPFVGSSGEIFNSMLREANIDRGRVWLTNIFKHRLPNNDFNKCELIGQTLNQALDILWVEINSISPNIIVALGGKVLTALTGKKTITNWRGSILSSTRGYPKVIPTYHPAHLLYSMETESDREISGYWQKYIITFDFKRAVAQSEFKEFRLPQRILHFAHNSSEVYDFLQRNRDKRMLSLDIETMRSIPVCIALAFTRYEAMSIPLLDTINGVKLCNIPPHDLAYCWNMIDQTLNDSRYLKIGQNFKFDQERLERICKITIDKLYGDTMLLGHILHPELPKSQAFFTSLYTEEPYYKDEGKEFNIKKDKIDRF